MNYEDRLRRLDEIVASLEGDGVPLDGALRLFEEGVELLRGASADLADAEARIRTLVEGDAGVFETPDLDE